MADTIADVVVTRGAFIDVAVATGIVAGTALDIQNKSSHTVILQVILAQPSAASTDGYFIVPDEILPIPSGTAGLWLRTAGKFPGKVMVRSTV